MKSVKKQFKQLLTEIQDTATELAKFSADLSLLIELQQLAEKILTITAKLKQECTALEKADFIEGIADSAALAELTELTDLDLLSMLEERFFNGLANQADTPVGSFLQELLDKIDHQYAQIVNCIEELTALTVEA